jgi:hypothetical protein
MFSGASTAISTGTAPARRSAVQCDRCVPEGLVQDTMWESAARPGDRREKRTKETASVLRDTGGSSELDVFLSRAGGPAPAPLADSILIQTKRLIH